MSETRQQKRQAQRKAKKSARRKTAASAEAHKKARLGTKRDALRARMRAENAEESALRVQATLRQTLHIFGAVVAMHEGDIFLSEEELEESTKENVLPFVVPLKEGGYRICLASEADDVRDEEVKKSTIKEAMAAVKAEREAAESDIVPVERPKVEL